MSWLSGLGQAAGQYVQGYANAINPFNTAAAASKAAATGDPKNPWGQGVQKQWEMLQALANKAQIKFAKDKPGEGDIVNAGELSTGDDAGDNPLGKLGTMLEKWKKINEALPEIRMHAGNFSAGIGGGGGASARGGGASGTANAQLIAALMALMQKKKGIGDVPSARPGVGPQRVR